MFKLFLLSLILMKLGMNDISARAYRVTEQIFVFAYILLIRSVFSKFYQILGFHPSFDESWMNYLTARGYKVTEQVLNVNYFS